MPGVATIPVSSFSNPLTAGIATFLPVLQVPLQQHAVATAQKLNQIQNCTGAIVITRGKYRRPNAPGDGEIPLYLHISAGARLETTAERIKAVDHAAAMVEEMLKHGSFNNGVNVNHLLSACVFLGFEADPSLNIAARIRGPNNQYVNHIMNETGVTVLLTGHGSGNSESAQDDEGQQPLNLLLSSNNPKILEHAKFLAENLLDTISAEFGFPHLKVYGAVPPPPQLLAGVQSSMDESNSNTLPPASLIESAMGSISSTFSSITVPGASDVASQGPVAHVTAGRSYNGYGGIYPQATPLQQVALTLRQSTSPVTAVVAPAVTIASTPSFASTYSSAEKDKHSLQKRKFQELPTLVKGQANPNQGLELAKPCELTSDVVAKDIKSLKQPSTMVCFKPLQEQCPPPPMPPPPPKFTSLTPDVYGGKNVHNESRTKSVPDSFMIS
ncbi:hypothetical protein ACH5RR_011245 [Cinchona calisaya]|uniref:Protein RIK n=1 Tax=Cinchona calisaya TaxID=153742 RepID=A0ABD3A4C3_9GENT